MSEIRCYSWESLQFFLSIWHWETLNGFGFFVRWYYCSLFFNIIKLIFSWRKDIFLLHYYRFVVKQVLQQHLTCIYAEDCRGIRDAKYDKTELIQVVVATLTVSFLESGSIDKEKNPFDSSMVVKTLTLCNLSRTSSIRVMGKLSPIIFSFNFR